MCVQQKQAKPKARWVTGRFVTRWEVSSFEPEKSNERWWVSFTEPSSETAKAAVDQSRPQGTTAEFYGVVSELGTFGHMGLYDREFRVQKVGRLEPVAIQHSEGPR